MRERPKPTLCLFSTTAMASEVTGTGAVEPRAGCLELQMLNARSAKVGKWAVGLFNPHIETWGPPQTTSAGAAFRTILVSESDPSKYVLAEVVSRGENRAAVNQAAARFQA